MHFLKAFNIPLIRMQSIPVTHADGECTTHSFTLQCRDQLLQQAWFRITVTYKRQSESPVGHPWHVDSVVPVLLTGIDKVAKSITVFARSMLSLYKVCCMESQSNIHHQRNDSFIKNADKPTPKTRVF